MLKKLYQKDGNIFINPSDDIKFGFYVIHNLRKDFQNINDYKKGYYQSLGMVYKLK